MLIKDVNPNKLHDELMIAGILPISVINDLQYGAYMAENTTITFAPGTDMIAVQAIIDAHDPIPFSKVLNDTEQRVADLELAIASILGGV